jgi:hypothetical protein
MTTRLLFTLLAFATVVLFTQANDPSATPKPPAFKVPKDWRAEKDVVVASARFHMGEGDKTATVTVVNIPKAAGMNLVPLVNRWRGQVGLKALEEGDAKKALRPVKLDGIAGYSLDVSGPDEPGKPRQRIVVAFVFRDDGMWSFRLFGHAGLVGEQFPAFQEFLKSVRFNPPAKE